jgi:hypothetical protein
LVQAVGAAFSAAAGDPPSPRIVASPAILFADLPAAVGAGIRFKF